MREAGGWQQSDDYARFPSLQLAARVPVELWLKENVPADLCPPPQSHLIASDLAQLNTAIPQPASEFVWQGEHNQATCLGMVWVVAGSALGNRAILAQLKKRSGSAASWPHAFLGDSTMISFWKTLRGRIEFDASSAEQEAAGRGALAVFDHFIAHTLRNALGSHRAANRA